jgi:signal transduction histidine kinase
MQLKERVKELNALHRTASILQRTSQTPAQALTKLVAILPAAWQYPKIAAVRISYDGYSAASRGFKKTKWMMRAGFKSAHGGRGLIEVAYLEKRPSAKEGPFLAEERALINSLAEMLESYLERKSTEGQILESRKILRRKVKERTKDLVRLNRSLRREIAERRRKEREISQYQRQLRSLASELSLSEERDRRSMAANLHDHIGQALAVIKMKFLQLHCNSVLCKFKDTIEDIRVNLDEAIETTRSITFELSPPVLYELGLLPALQWLADEFQRKHGISVEVTTEGSLRQMDDNTKANLFKSTRELLFNAAKHARVSQVWVRIIWEKRQIRIEVRDDGVGFDASRLLPIDIKRSGFGLFSVKERMGYIGGRLTIDSMPGHGARATLMAPLSLRNEGDNGCKNSAG